VDVVEDLADEVGIGLGTIARRIGELGAKTP
jgi:hypothetical protein